MNQSNFLMTYLVILPSVAFGHAFGLVLGFCIRILLAPLMVVKAAAQIVYYALVWLWQSVVGEMAKATGNADPYSPDDDGFSDLPAGAKVDMDAMARLDAATALDPNASITLAEAFGLPPEPKKERPMAPIQAILAADKAKRGW